MRDSVRGIPPVIFFLSIFIRLFLIFGIGSCSALAPDEGAYISLFNYLYHGGRMPGELSFALSNHLFLLLYYLPAEVISWTKLPTIYCLRLSSLFYFLILCLILNVVNRGITQRGMLHEQGRTGSLLKRLPWLVLFVPSFIIWTSSGVRDVAGLIAISLVALGVMRLQSRSALKSTLLICFGLIIAINVREYLFALLSVALTLICIFEYLKSRQSHFKLSFSFLLFNLLTIPVAFMTTPSVSQLTHIPSVATAVTSGNKIIQETKINPSSSQNTPSSKSSSIAELSVGSEISGSMTKTLISQCLKSNTFGIFDLPVLKNGISSILGLEGANNVKANTNQEVNVSKTGVKSPSLGSSKNSGADLPYSVPKGSLRNPVTLFPLIPYLVLAPIPFYTRGFFAQLMSVEFFINLGILIFIAMSVMNARRFKLVKFAGREFAIIFSFSFIVFSALAELNLGTYMRHRMALLIPLFILLSGIKAREEIKTRPDAI